MLKVLIPIFLFGHFASYAQSISPEEARKLVNKLTDSQQDTVQINVLLRLAKYHVFKPGENKIDLDSAARFISRAEKLNTQVKSQWASGYILLIKSYLMKESGQREKAKETVESAVAILKDGDDKLLAGETYLELSDYYGYYEKKELDERIRLVELALSCFQQTGNMEKIGRSHHVLGDLYHIYQKNPEALQHLRGALMAYDSANYPSVQGIYILMGSIYNGIGDFKQSLNYGLLGLQTAENTGDTSLQLCQINNGIARTLIRLNERKEAIRYLSEALRIAEKYKDINSIYIVATNMANNYVVLGHPQQGLRTLKDISSKYKMPNNPAIDFNVGRCYIAIYSELKQYDKATPYCDHLLSLFDEEDAGSFTTIEVYASVIRFYIISGQYERALKYLNKHKRMSGKQNDISLMATNHKLWFMLDTTKHNYRSAVDHLLSYNDLNDSLFNETKGKQIAALQVEFDTERKEKDLLVKEQNIQLLTKQDQLQKSKLQTGAVIRNVSFAIVGLLITIMALLYNRYRLKQKTNRELESQQREIAKQNHSLQHLLSEKEWLLKEIHHRVKNNLQIVMSLLNSQSAFVQNESALTAIHDSQHRVHAMSLIHQKLYSTENVSSIDMSIYIRELVSYLRDSFNTAQRIRFELHVEPLELDVSQAVPLGLILNEAITNSIKYAFPNDMKGVITISLSNTGFHNYLLIISDNGIGMPAHVKDKKPGSLGMSLMEGLSEDLDGNFSIVSDNGTMIKISFVHDTSVKRPEPMVSSFVTNN